MATIEPYETKAGKRYMVRYRTPDRRTTMKRGFTSKRQASDWLAENTVKVNTGEWRPAAAGRTTVNEAAKTWFSAKKPTVAVKTAAGYEDSLIHIEKIGTLGNTRLSALTSESIEQWLNAMSQHQTRAGKPLSAKTIRNSFAVLSQVLKRAVRDRRIPANPCDGVDLPRVEKRDQLILTASELEAVATAAGEYHGWHIRALGMTGLRWGELAGLQVQDVNLDSRRLHVQHQITESNGKLIHGLPKYGKRRIVPIIEPLADLLEERCRGKASTDLVFTTPAGGVLRNQNARRDWFDPAAKQAGFPDLTPHDLRHTFASVAISAGANVKALQQALGHHSAAFTLDQYGHLFPDDLGGFTHVMGQSFSTKCAQNVLTNNDQGTPSI